VRRIVLPSEPPRAQVEVFAHDHEQAPECLDAWRAIAALEAADRGLGGPGPHC
jgi:hypothetical protein